MAPPVQAMVNALGHCGGCTPPNLNAIWTLQGRRSPKFKRAGPMPERAGDSILSSRHRHGTVRTPTRARLRMEGQHDPIQADTPAQSGLCGPVSHAAPWCAVVGRPRRASGLLPGGPVPLPGRVAGVHAPRADGGGGTARGGVRAVQAQGNFLLIVAQGRFTLPEKRLSLDEGLVIILHFQLRSRWLGRLRLLTRTTALPTGRALAPHGTELCA